MIRKAGSGIISPITFNISLLIKCILGTHFQGVMNTIIYECGRIEYDNLNCHIIVVCRVIFSERFEAQDCCAKIEQDVYLLAKIAYLKSAYILLMS